MAPAGHLVPAERRDAGHAGAPAGPGYDRRVTILVDLGTAGMRLASRLRGERAIHARGRTFTGTVTLPGAAGTGAPLLDTAGTYDAVVRFSRSAGLPAWLPDVYGLGVRLVDAHGPGRHQDLLLDATQPAPLLRRLPWPRWDATSAVYSSLLPYDVGGRRVLLGAVIVEIVLLAPLWLVFSDDPATLLLALPDPAVAHVVDRVQRGLYLAISAGTAAVVAARWRAASATRLAAPESDSTLASPSASASGVGATRTLASGVSTCVCVRRSVATIGRPDRRYE